VDLPPMLIQPFVENAIKHGLPKNGLPGLLQIRFYLKGKYLICTVSDNGPGIDKKAQDKKLHQSAGIEITQKRLDNFFKDQNISPLIFEQRLDEGGSICGTDVTIVLPAKL
jgi:sensor histidine kinase YesM